MLFLQKTQIYLKLELNYEIGIFTICKFENNSAFQLLKVTQTENIHQITTSIW